MKKSWPWLVIIAIILFVKFDVYHKIQGTDEQSIGLVMARGNASVQIVAISSDRAQITVTRSSGGPDMTVVIPAGTPVSDPEPGSQQLATARTVRFTIGANSHSATQTVYLFCLTQFALPPTAGAKLAISSSVGAGEESEPVQKLLQCLDKNGDDGASTHKAEQLAVWILTGNYLDQPYEAVRAALQAKLSAESTQEIDRDAQGGVLDEVRAKLSQLIPASEVPAALENIGEPIWASA